MSESSRGAQFGTPKRKRRPPDRFGALVERNDARDFPFYAGSPVGLSTARWLVVWAACLVGFLALILIPTPDNWVELVPRTLFVVIPLVVLGLASGGYWRALFHRVTGWDVLAMVFFWILNFAVTLVVGTVLSAVTHVSANPVSDTVGTAGAGDTVAFYLGTGIQLVGEEVFTVLPFLAILHFLVAGARLSRRTAVVLAWLLSALWFGAAHLPTYHWNVAQALIGIGVARLVLSLAYIRTKNLWVSAGAHILNDWAGFTIALAGNR